MPYGVTMFFVRQSRSRPIFIEWKIEKRREVCRTDAQQAKPADTLGYYVSGRQRPAELQNRTATS